MQPGFLIVDKETGTRSTSCVASVKRALGKQIKVGHGGTLDSTASGILVILIGRATRASKFVMALPKVYVTTARFGLKTSTDDFSGEIIEKKDASYIDGNMIDRALLSFMGLRDQVPPSVSAVRIEGKRAHSIARNGCFPDLAPRPVFVSSIRRISDPDPSADVGFRILCQKGTYVRSIVRDLGDMLGCGATVLSLERSEIGPFKRDLSVPGNIIFNSDRKYIEHKMVPVSMISESYTSYRVNVSDESDVISGQGVPMKDLERISWGKYASDNVIIIQGRGFTSFGYISNISGVSFVCPKTTILSGEID